MAIEIAVADGKSPHANPGREAAGVRPEAIIETENGGSRFPIAAFGLAIRTANSLTVRPASVTIANVAGLVDRFAIINHVKRFRKLQFDPRYITFLSPHRVGRREVGMASDR